MRELSGWEKDRKMEKEEMERHRQRANNKTSTQDRLVQKRDREPRALKWAQTLKQCCQGWGETPEADFSDVVYICCRQM